LDNLDEFDNIEDIEFEIIIISSSYFFSWYFVTKYYCIVAQAQVDVEILDFVYMIVCMQLQMTFKEDACKSWNHSGQTAIALISFRVLILPAHIMFLQNVPQGSDRMHSESLA
jgi:hypothetical protein